MDDVGIDHDQLVRLHGEQLVIDLKLPPRHRQYKIALRSYGNVGWRANRRCIFVEEGYIAQLHLVAGGVRHPSGLKA